MPDIDFTYCVALCTKGDLDRMAVNLRIIQPTLVIETARVEERLAPGGVAVAVAPDGQVTYMLVAWPVPVEEPAHAD